MSDLVREHIPFLEFITSVSDKQAIGIIKTLSRGQLKAVIEIFMNLRFGNIKLTPILAEKLNRKRIIIRQFTDKSVSLKKKRDLFSKNFKAILHLLNLTLPAVKKVC